MKRTQRAKGIRPAAGQAARDLLFCGNCRVSIPLPELRSGRAVHASGDALCARCADADEAGRALRRDTVEKAMADAQPVKEVVALAPVPQAPPRAQPAADDEVAMRVGSLERRVFKLSGDLAAARGEEANARDDLRSSLSERLARLEGRVDQLASQVETLVRLSLGAASDDDA